MIHRKISHHMSETPHTIGENSTVRHARELMREYSYHHLPVLRGGLIVGMISERDLRIAESLKKEDNTLISEIMSDEPFMVERDADIKDVLTQMQHKGYSSAIVKGTSNNTWGIFTYTDALRLLLSTL